MTRDKERAAEKVLKGIDATKTAVGGKCGGCGYEAEDNEFFKCEECGAPICTYCHNMTNDCGYICRACIEKMGLTADDLMFEEDAAGRPFF